MKGIYVDGDISFITYPDGTSTFCLGEAARDPGDVCVGGGNPDISVRALLRSVMAEPCPVYVSVDSTSVRFVSSEGEASFTIPHELQVMWGAATREDVRSAIDEKVSEYAAMEDDIWDKVVFIDSGDISLRSSDCLEGLRRLSDVISANVSDPTLTTVIISRLCMYKSFRDAMPSGTRCMTPAEISAAACAYARHEGPNSLHKGDN